MRCSAKLGVMSSTTGEKLGPWSPGISSAIPERYLPLATIYRSENVFTSLQQARELADFTGLAPPCSGEGFDPSA